MRRWKLQARLGMAIVLISHDLNIVHRFADRLYVMRSGEVVESGTTRAVFTAPQHAYTQMLLAAEPTGTKQAPPADARSLLDGDNLGVTYNIKAGLFGGKPIVLKAVDNVSIHLREGQTIGIVGESGSGKSTLGRALLRLVGASGRIRFEGEDISRRFLSGLHSGLVICVDMN